MPWTCRVCTFIHGQKEELFLSCLICGEVRGEESLVLSHDDSDQDLQLIRGRGAEADALADAKAAVEAKAAEEDDAGEENERNGASSTSENCTAGETINADPELEIQHPTHPCQQRRALLSHSASVLALEEAVTQCGGWERIDGSNWIKTSDGKSGASGNEQWGRALPELVQQMISLTGLKSSDRFVDVGSGCGQVVLLCVMSVGCNSLGVEVVAGRHAAALQIRENLADVLYGKASDSPTPTRGTVSRASSSGRSEQNESKAAAADRLVPFERAEVHFAMNQFCDFMLNSFTDEEAATKIRQADVLFVNNACGIFSPERGGLDLNSKLGNIMCEMKDGSRFLTLDTIPSLDPFTDRVESSNFFASSDGSLPSFRGAFTVFKTESAPGVCSWREGSGSTQPLYLYTKRRNVWNCSRCSMENDLTRNQCIAYTEQWDDGAGKRFCAEAGRSVRDSTRLASGARGSKRPSLDERFETADGAKKSGRSQKKIAHLDGYSSESSSGSSNKGVPGSGSATPGKISARKLKGSGKTRRGESDSDGSEDGCFSN